MLYPFMTLNDNTEIVHSKSLQKDGKEQVEVRIEKLFTADSIPLHVGCLIISGKILMDSLMKKLNIFRIIWHLLRTLLCS